MPTGSFVYPVRQRWFVSRTQMGNEPTYVDDGESIGSSRINYHSGLDIGGAEGLVDVVAATGGLVVGPGTAVIDAEKNTASVDGYYTHTERERDDPGLSHRQTHLHILHP